MFVQIKTQDYSVSGDITALPIVVVALVVVAVGLQLLRKSRSR